MLPASTPILIVGAGPAGLSCALSLITNGVKHQDIVIVDAQGKGLNSSRAIVVHARTLEELDTVGCSEKLVSEGNVNKALRVCSGRSILMEADFPSLAGRTQFPFALTIAQNVTERVLEDRLDELGLTVSRPYRMSDLKGVDDGVEATFESGEVIKAKFLVGADGSRSQVRSLCGIGFKDPATGEDPHSDAAREQSHREKPLIIADVHFEGEVPSYLIDRVYLGIYGPFLFFRLSKPSAQKHLYRLAGLAAPGTEITTETVQKYFEIGLDLAHDTAPKIESIVFSSSFHPRFAVADQLYQSVGGGLVALVGDAAHIHSPAGGQGMNLGIRDAVALGRVLANLQIDTSGNNNQEIALKALESYSDERHALALKVIGMTKGLTRFVVVENFLLRKLRNIFLWTLGRLPGFGGRMAFNLSGIQ